MSEDKSICRPSLSAGCVERGVGDGKVERIALRGACGERCEERYERGMC